MNNYVMALFASGTTNFDYMGLGPLADAISAVATETATSNGNITYTMEMDYPINGRLASQLVEGNLIKAQVSKTPGDYMIFEINETLKSDDRTITVYCDAYANRILRMSFDNGGKFGSFGNVQQALNAARAQMTGIQSDFTLSSGIGTSLNMSGVTSKNTLPTTYQDFNAYLDAIMDKVQGNVRFGVNSIQIVSDRGRDITDTVLRDDKNTNGISIKVDTSNIVNRIIPMLPVKDKNGNVTQETKVGKIVTSSVAFKFINFYAGQVVSLDTQDLANSYFNRTNCDRPTTTATVQTSMLDEDLTDIRLFDRVQVYSSKIGYQAKLRVCERDFDILAGAVSEFKLGSSSVTVFNSQTSVINAVNSAVQSSQYAAITADGKNTAYYEGANPDKPKENDLWFHSVNGINQIDQYVNGNWVTIVSDSTGEEINKKVSEVGAEAKSAVSKAESASDKADQLASKYDDTNSLASQAMRTAVSAQGDASSAVAVANSTASEFGKVNQKADSAVASALNAQSAASDAVATANSTASEFGKVSQKTDSAVANSLNAQSAASDAVEQASSAAADSKDAKQIAGAVSQSYKTLTDGSTMTIAELESGLAVKLTKSDLDGYATETWTQNQVKMTADGINGTMSSIKGTVDSQTTSINDLKADSSSFKSQFTTVNNTLGKQTTDISSLQASSKELTSGFNTLTSDNTTNKNDISQLKQTSTEVSSTLETVKTQVQNSAVGTNLAVGTAQEYPMGYGIPTTTWKDSYAYEKLPTTITNDEILPQDPHTFWYSLTQGETYTQTIWFETDANIKDLGVAQISWYTNSGHDFQPATLVNLGENKYKIYSTYTWPGKSDNSLRLFDIFHLNSAFDLSTGTYLKFGKLKLEKGNLSTDWCLNPADTATVTAMSKLSQTVDGIKTDVSKKIEQKDLNGYATETWAQNQINISADGLNGTISSVKSTVDGHTTSINDLKADSSGFKAQFQTVNDALGKQTTDIGSLQASSKELTSGFNTLTSDNTTNKNDISQLKQTSTELSSTMTTVQTQVQNSAVGTNLIVQSNFKNGYLDPSTGSVQSSSIDFNSDYIATNGATIFTFSSPDYVFKGDGGNDRIAMYDSDKNYLGYQPLNSPTQTLSKSNVAYIRFSINSQLEGNTATNSSDWLANHRYKLEKGSVATDYSVNPEDNATVTAFSQLSQTVDGMKADISKKIEQKDLSGYATQTWTQNQIKTTADGINGTISSVKSTVDGHTTSINALQADSSGFKAQFQTVNDTIGKHTTDIGTLQASAKSLSASFDSLNSDNDTNKHNISQLQASATTFNSTLLTVQQKVEDGLISTNIFRSANDLSRSYWTDPLGYQFTTFQAESRYHDSLIHYQGQGKTPAPYSTIAQQNITDDAMAADTWYTLSFYARGAGDNNTVGKFAVYFYGNGSDQSMSSSDGVEVLGTSDTHCIITLTPYFRRYVITFHTPKDFAGGHSFWARNDLDLNDGSLYCDFWHPKLELGKVASDFSVNPADTATISALSSISQTVDAIQTTVRGKVDNDTYQSKMTQINNAIIAKVSKGDVTNENILPYSGYWSDTTGWTLMPWGAADRSMTLFHHDFYHNAVDATLVVGTSMADTASIGSTKFSVIPNTTYTFTFWGFASSNVKGTNVYVLGRTFTSTKDYDYVHQLQANLIMSPSGINKYTATFTTNSDETQAYVRLDNQGSTNGQSSGAYFAELKLERGDTATPYTRVSSGEIQVTSDNINLKVSKDGVVSAINISPESITIDGKRLHITAATYIDNAVIKDAMIANLSANKLTAGSINAASINVYNINGANIVANSITADKLQAESMLIAMNSTLQTLKVSTNGLLTTDRNGKVIGQIHTNRSVQHPENWGLDFDLNSDGKFMSWGAQNEGDPNGDYGIKFGWTRSSSASDFGMPWGGFWFNDNVMLHKNLRFDGGGVDVAGAYQLMKFAWIEMNGTHYPFFGSSNLKAGWLFGSNETYLVRGGGVINASKILGVLNGQSYKFIKSLNPDGSVKVYTDVHF